jgi:DNA-binding NarL/FixJ family response regulator
MSSGREAKSARVAIVDDVPVFRESLLEALEGIGFDVVGQGANGLEAVRLVQELRPDVVVIDLRMPEMNGVEATREIKRLDPTVEIVMLTAYDDESLVAEAAEAGVRHYLVKGCSEAVIAECLAGAWIDRMATLAEAAR